MGGGGAVYAQPSSRFEDCLFKDNKTLNVGSAICGGVTGAKSGENRKNKRMRGDCFILLFSDLNPNTRC
jgi:hypothetical protein